jgi:hypothetical protein
MQHLVEVEPISMSPASYIDYSVTNSILSGLLLAVLAAWAMVVFNRLWQSSIRVDAADAIAGASAGGLEVLPDGLRARVVAEGSVGSERVRVEWRGGWQGSETLILRGDSCQRMALVASASELRQHLGMPPQ